MEWIAHHSHAHEPTRWVSACGRAEVLSDLLPRSAYKWRVIVDGASLFRARGGCLRKFKSVEAAKWAAAAKIRLHSA